MRDVKAFSWLAASLALLVACTHSPYHLAGIEGDYCAFDGVVFDGRFEGGRLSGCARDGRGSYVLYVRPEGEPINPSPWYAFDMTAHHRGPVSIKLDYGDFRHRYSPDLKPENDRWRPFDGDIDLQRDGQVAAFAVETCNGCTVRIAGHPLILPEDTFRWMEAQAREDVDFGVLGLSAEGEPIHKLESGAGLKDWLLIIGRQHPPELTGAVAMQAFVKRLLADEPSANAFRRNYGLLIAPMLNPDGVLSGNWRFESSGVDLNRDWGPFDRPESRLIREEINARKALGRRLVAALDFHSTRKDVLYTQPDNEADFGWLPGAWHMAINKRLAQAAPPQRPIERSAAHNPGKPTFKTWLHTAHGAPGVTVEFGDETPPARLDLIGRIAAEELMRVLEQDGPIAE